MIQLNNTKSVIPEKWQRLFLLFFLIIPFLNPPVLDNDIWFLLNHGRHVLQNGIPYIEPFTLHEGLTFVMQQWMSCVLFWITYSSVGRFGLVLLTDIIYFLILIMVYKTCMLVTDGYFEISYGIALLTGAILRVFMVTRPQVISLFMMTIELYSLESYARSGKKSSLYVLPLLSVLMVNMHASMWPMLFVLMLPYLLDAIPFKTKLISGAGYPLKPLITATAVTAAFGLINPYGTDSMTYLLRSYGVPVINGLVREMCAPDIKTIVGKYVFGCVLIITLIYIFYRKGSSTLRYMLLSLGTLYLTLSSIRGFQIMLVCYGFPLAYYLKDVQLPASADAEPDGKTLRIRKLLIALITIVIIISCAKNIKTVTDDLDAPPSKGAVEYLLANFDPASIRLYNNYNDGDYSEFMGIPTYMDARAEVFLKACNEKEDILDEYVMLQSGKIHYEDFLEKYKFTHVLATDFDLLYVYLENDTDYRISYEDEYCRIYEPVK